MKHLFCTASAFALSATAALAGGVDRSGQPIGVLFEQGTYAELSFGSLRPDVSGSEVFPLPLPGVGGFDDSGDMAPDFVTFSAAFKHDVNDRLSFALILDKPYGAEVDYDDGTGYFAADSTATLHSFAATAIGRYKFTERISVHAGLRYQELSAKAVVPFVNGVDPSTGGGLPGVPSPGTPYEAYGKQDGGWGYVLGGAYEIPDIALRVALTYNSRIDHELDTTETSALGPDFETKTDITTPQSVNLDFQTGIAPDTLLFGGVRWVEWSEFDITPQAYETLTGGASLVSYEDDTYTYTLGVGRRFTEQWAGQVSVGYEKQNGGFASNLGPTDGQWSLGLGGSYTMDKIEISAGVRYVWIGDAETQAGPAAPVAEFEDNSAVGVGFKIGYTF
ncbi:OmpP1/FadL family transporter [Roseivivax isoporae]|uniref:Membrane protein n=1 Tax=Roseivivax isoporae LMG 25204 TaxID=1449351 RepID=X7F6B4_9RHOB|nr:outer membrane protein transport protein [Roseivivax isoporae]ETX28288.1 membrane protein [Roseivivax isoporae LMG 25204]